MSKPEKLLAKVKQDHNLLQALATVLPPISIEFIETITIKIRCLEKACGTHTVKALEYLIGVCKEKQIGAELSNSEREEFFQLMAVENEKYEYNQARYGVKKAGKYHG